MTHDQGIDLDPEIQRDLITQLAAVVLEQAAPEELAVFDETAEEYFRDPEAILDPQRRDEPVGFGLEASLLTPVVLSVASYVVQFVVATVRDAAKDEARPMIVSLVRRVFRRPDHKQPDDSDAAAAPEPLTDEQARTVRRIAYERAQALGVPESTAGVLADAVVGGIVVQS